MGIVLVVDDDLDLLAALDETLTDEGWKVLTAGSASSALGAARSCRVDVVLTDLMMPFGDGPTLESAFKADPALSDVPFVFMSGAIKEVKELHAARVLVKPFQAEDVVAMLKSCLRREAREERHP